MSARRAHGAALLAPIAWLTLAAGCGGGQTPGGAFDRGWTNDRGAGITAFQRQFAATPVPLGVDVAVGVIADGHARRLVGAPLGGGGRWTFEHALDGRPALAGTVVVGAGRGELFALDARTGRLLWKRPAGGRLRGAGDDGATTVVSLQPTSGAGSVLLALNHDGDVLRQIEDDVAIGAPAVVGRYAFLPWQGQYVTVFDLQSGGEVARVLLRTQVSRAFLSGGAVFFGEATATRLDDAIGRGEGGRASTVALPAGDLPGAPRWMTTGTEPLDVSASAADKIRVYARPAASGPASVEGGRFAATYFRIAVGLDASTGALAWARAANADFLGGAAYPGGFALCDARGDVTLLDAQRGTPAGQVSLGEPLEACIVQADAVKTDAVKTDAVKARSTAAAEPLSAQLARVVALPEAELMSMQRLLLQRMAALPDDAATRSLLELASGERTPALLREDARKALARRRNGAELMLEALGRHYDFLAGALRPPPVGPLADALAAMNEKRAAPLLAAHLNDPESTPDDLQRAAAALNVLAGKPELPALRTFFALYRGVDDESLAAAVESVAEALVKGGDGEVVARAASDAFTTPSLRERLARIAGRGSGGKPTLGR